MKQSIWDTFMIRIERNERLANFKTYIFKIQSLINGRVLRNGLIVTYQLVTVAVYCILPSTRV